VPEDRQESIDTTLVVATQIDVLKPVQPKRCLTRLHPHRKDGLTLFQCVGHFIEDVGRLHRPWGEHDNEAGGTAKRLFDGCIPARADWNVELIQPDIGAVRGQGRCRHLYHYFHTDQETPDTVPWTGLEATTRASSRIIDEVNTLALTDLQRPEELEAPGR